MARLRNPIPTDAAGHRFTSEPAGRTRLRARSGGVTQLRTIAVASSGGRSMPRRRLSVVVAAAALTLAALAGCQVEPGTAAYVGNTTYTKADVDKILARVERDSSKLDPRQEQGVRQQISLFQVFVDVATRFAGEQHYGGPALDPPSVAQQIGLPESDPYVQLLTKV